MHRRTKIICISGLTVVLVGGFTAVHAAPILGDANLDGIVDLVDFSILKAHFGQDPAVWADGDFNNDGHVDIADFFELKQNFGEGSGTSAGVITDPAQGALQMTLSIDASGNASLTNNTGAALDVDGYEIWSAGGNLDPTNGSGWMSLQDWAEIDASTLMASLGVGGLQFGEFRATTGLLAEFNLSNSATFQAFDEFSIGKAASSSLDLGDLTFYYSKPGVEGQKFLGLIVPEPATLSLLAVGALVVIRRKRR